MTITNRQQLIQAIADAEQKKIQQQKDVSEQLDTVYESFKPAHILKSTLQNVIGNTGLGSSLLKTTAGVGAGYLAGKILPGKAAKVSGRILGSVLKLAVAGIASKGMSKIKTGAANLLRKALPVKRTVSRSSSLK